MMEKLMIFLRKITSESAGEEQECPHSSQNDGMDTSVVTPSRIRGVTSPPFHYLNVSPVALFLLQHLNDEEWDKVEDCMHSSMTRSQFASLCTDISEWVSEAAKRITLPALALVLDVTITESRPSSPLPSSEESSLKSAAQITSELLNEEFLVEKHTESKVIPEPLQAIDTSRATPPEPVSSSRSRSQLGSDMFLTESWTAGRDMVQSTSTESSSDLNELNLTEASCHQFTKMISSDSMADYRAVFSTASLPSETFVELSDEEFQKSARRAVSEVPKLSKIGQSQIAVPFLTEDIAGTSSSPVSLNIDAAVDSAASDIVEVLIEDLHDLSESVRSFTPQSSNLSESTAIVRLPAFSVFKSLRRKLKDMFTHHPSSLPKTSECTSSQPPTPVESVCAGASIDSFNVEADTATTGTERMATNIVDVIMSRISQDAEQMADSKSPEERKLEMLLSAKTIRLLSSELVDKVYHLIMEDSSALPVLRTAIRRIKSDSALSKPGVSGRLELAREAFSELVYAFTEKCLKHLLEECLRLLPRDLANCEDDASVSEMEVASTKSTERWNFGQSLIFRTLGSKKSKAQPCSAAEDS